jgi:hypothetical protein
VGVVLGEAADAGHAVEFARLLPAVDGAEFRKSDREVPVAVRLGGEDLDVMGAVHRLQHEAVEQLIVGQDVFFRDDFFACTVIELLA